MKNGLVQREEMQRNVGSVPILLSLPYRSLGRVAALELSLCRLMGKNVRYQDVPDHNVDIALNFRSLFTPMRNIPSQGKGTNQ